MMAKSQKNLVYKENYNLSTVLPSSDNHGLSSPRSQKPSFFKTTLSAFIAGRMVLTVRHVRDIRCACHHGALEALIIDRGKLPEYSGNMALSGIRRHL